MERRCGDSHDITWPCRGNAGLCRGSCLHGQHPRPGCRALDVGASRLAHRRSPRIPTSAGHDVQGCRARSKAPRAPAPGNTRTGLQRGEGMPECWAQGPGLSSIIYGLGSAVQTRSPTGQPVPPLWTCLDQAQSGLRAAGCRLRVTPAPEPPPQQQLGVGLAGRWAGRFVAAGRGLQGGNGPRAAREGQGWWGCENARISQPGGLAG